MNIFATDADPVKSAYNLDDRRLIKMILESAQMLSTALHCVSAPPRVLTKIYKPTHVNHPCNVWVRATNANYMWLLQHFEAMLWRYTTEFYRTHKCEELLDTLRQSAIYIPNGELQPFANCAARKDFGIDYKNITDPIYAYRFYLCERWRREIVQGSRANSVNNSDITDKDLYRVYIRVHSLAASLFKGYSLE